jgi:hypothetical protein
MSMSATASCRSWARATARFVASVVLPIPPLAPNREMTVPLFVTGASPDSLRRWRSRRWNVLFRELRRSRVSSGFVR